MGTSVGSIWSELRKVAANIVVSQTGPMIERGIVKCRYGFCDLHPGQLGYGLLASMGWITRDSDTDMCMRQRRRQTWSGEAVA